MAASVAVEPDYFSLQPAGSPRGSPRPAVIAGRVRKQLHTPGSASSARTPLLVPAVVAATAASASASASAQLLDRPELAHTPPASAPASAPVSAPSSTHGSTNGSTNGSDAFRLPPSHVPPSPAPAVEPVSSSTSTLNISPTPSGQTQHTQKTTPSAAARQPDSNELALSDVSPAEANPASLACRRRRKFIGQCPMPPPDPNFVYKKALRMSSSFVPEKFDFTIPDILPLLPNRTDSDSDSVPPPPQTTILSARLAVAPPNAFARNPSSLCPSIHIIMENQQHAPGSKSLEAEAAATAAASEAAAPTTPAQKKSPGIILEEMKLANSTFVEKQYHNRIDARLAKYAPKWLLATFLSPNGPALIPYRFNRQDIYALFRRREKDHHVPAFSPGGRRDVDPLLAHNVGLTAWDSQTATVTGAAETGKNRYADILPFQNHTVSIRGGGYLNASLIEPWTHYFRNRYIALQCPVPDSFPDFWNGVVKQDVRLVVMLTRIKEGQMEKGHNYWADQQYGPDIQIKHARSAVISLRTPAIDALVRDGLDAVPFQAEPISEHFDETKDLVGSAILRVFDLTVDGATRTVFQLHYGGWTDFSAPSSTTEVVNLARLANLIQYAPVPTAPVGGAANPMMVHCSAGVGRTGVLCGLMYLAEFYLGSYFAGMGAAGTRPTEKLCFYPAHVFPGQPAVAWNKPEFRGEYETPTLNPDKLLSDTDQVLTTDMIEYVVAHMRQFRAKLVYNPTQYHFLYLALTEVFSLALRQIDEAAE